MNETEVADEMQAWWIPISAAFLPFLVWPVEMVFPFPALIEETAKGYLVWLIINKPGLEGRKQMALSVGLLFGGSETLLYTVNAILAGNLGLMVGRVLLTMPMHIITVMVMYWLGQRGKLGFILGWILAVGIHAGFNAVVSSW
jgi:hypothetical protein